jgi:hypothetical protein
MSLIFQPDNNFKRIFPEPNLDRFCFSITWFTVIDSYSAVARAAAELYRASASARFTLL